MRKRGVGLGDSLLSLCVCVVGGGGLLWSRQAACLAPLVPARVVPVHDQLSLQAALVDADIAIVEALAVGLDELAGAQRLCCVQKFGTLAANIDLAACAARGVAVEVGHAEHHLSDAQVVLWSPAVSPDSTA